MTSSKQNKQKRAIVLLGEQIDAVERYKWALEEISAGAVPALDGVKVDNTVKDYGHSQAILEAVAIVRLYEEAIGKRNLWALNMIEGGSKLSSVAFKRGETVARTRAFVMRMYSRGRAAIEDYLVEEADFEPTLEYRITKAKEDAASRRKKKTCNA